MFYCQIFKSNKEFIKITAILTAMFQGKKIRKEEYPKGVRILDAFHSYLRVLDGMTYWIENNPAKFPSANDATLAISWVKQHRGLTGKAIEALTKAQALAEAQTQAKMLKAQPVNQSQSQSQTSENPDMTFQYPSMSILAHPFTQALLASAPPPVADPKEKPPELTQEGAGLAKAKRSHDK